MSGHAGNQNFILGDRPLSGCVLYLDATNSLVSSSYGFNTSEWSPVLGSSYTLYNSPAYSSSFSGGCVNFNGSTQYAVNDSNLSLYFHSSAVSFNMWFYPVSQGQIVSEWGQSNYGGWHDAQLEIYNNGANSGSFSFIIWGGYNTNYVRSAAVPYNKWYMLTLTHTGTILTGYLNGNSLGTKNFTREAPYNNGYQLFYALCRSDETNTIGTTAYAGGKVGHFSVYNSAISATDITNLYSGSKARFGL